MTRFPTFDNAISREGACTGGLSTVLCRVCVFEVRIGMFVEELDKPWLESGFPLQGFFVETQEQIEQLREECVFVYVNQSSISSTPESERPRKAQFHVVNGGVD